MDSLISSRGKMQSVPESYNLPPETRPGDLVAPLLKTIPVIDLETLGPHRNELIQHIIKASQEYGFFQLTNHGVSEELMNDVLTMGAEFFNLPEKDKARYYSERSQSPEVCRLKTSNDYADEKVHFWRDNFRHPCHPLEDYIQHWPENPPRYREVVGRFSVEVRRLSLRLLNLICEGLGLEQGYFEERFCHGHLLSINHYPPCPDPTSVLGFTKHADPFLITFLNQGHVPGLQVLKDREWLGIEPLPNAFVVNINHMLQVISNGKLKSPDHRVVTNSKAARTTVVSFILPSSDCLIEPPKSLVNEHNPAVYRTFKFGDFLKTFYLDVREGICKVSSHLREGRTCQFSKYATILNSTCLP
ncbi:2'-deoxymugineic-acid 2'-dioxygenase-like isoform X2 [Diospyros lotus]|uniref:2'-deoxymugineic-acid 2'-dioxygenase-like isoform X2 n=1 Tax=Diospyros lotus TaxID=55363 RepID=UPI002256CE25|nr:2'-deoxymugineic-acid 2'-dioxygenase-like isoform X2 [Diospyros lotus]XP_052169947.1 2'-deoxymugineic-acid 2'-dioxygenase-like isoform X2 [Diospyros lotus]XP_052169948.1 2'-deoxymugineic-acid 2'-dioxygenase-like isoform X2 [Diospyros lotus]XP_052169950.1 2'-deoxymugineic-acid 2'-dioxygenase-like isoform X2 [Diospyros lotus]